MSHHPHHEHLIKEMAKMFSPLFKKSPQAIYIYLDDEHKICNKKFADMLGYKSVNAWVKNQYPVDDLDPKDQKRGIQAYMKTSEKFQAATLAATWIKKNGKKIKTMITMVPLTYQNEVFVLHFISPK